jgi:hypothetical protein
MALTTLDSCLEILRRQGIFVDGCMMSEDGFVLEVKGFLLTASQMLKLCESGQLNLEGIKAFAKSVQGDHMARKAVPQNISH